MRAAIASLLLLLAGATAPAAAVSPDTIIRPATIDETLDVAGESMAARLVETRMFVAVAVNGRGPFRFLVDSGADRSVIGTELARRLALADAGAATLQSMAGPSAVETVMIDRLGVGASAVEDIRAPVLPERHLGAQGVLGIDALVGHRMMLDFDARTITLQDARVRERPRLDDEIVVTARRRRGQLILTQASVGGEGVLAVIDTGAQQTMGNSALRARLFAGRRPPAATRIELVSVTGAVIVADLIVVGRLRIGSLVLENVSIAFADVPPFALFGIDQRPAMLLGTDVLEAFSRVSLDFRARKVRFRPRRGSRGGGS